MRAILCSCIPLLEPFLLAAVIQQLTSFPLYVGAITLLWTYASLVPITKGVQNNEAFGGYWRANL